MSATDQYYHRFHVESGELNELKLYSLNRILLFVSHMTDVEVELMQSATRTRRVSEARFIFFSVARYLTTETSAKVGSLVNRHYSSVIYGENICNSTPYLKRKRNKILDYIHENGIDYENTEKV